MLVPPSIVSPLQSCLPFNRVPPSIVFPLQSCPPFNPVLNEIIFCSWLAVAFCLFVCFCFCFVLFGLLNIVAGENATNHTAGKNKDLGTSVSYETIIHTLYKLPHTIPVVAVLLLLLCCCCCCVVVVAVLLLLLCCCCCCVVVVAVLLLLLCCCCCCCCVVVVAVLLLLCCCCVVVVICFVFIRASPLVDGQLLQTLGKAVAQENSTKTAEKNKSLSESTDRPFIRIITQLVS